ncbi:tRNA pseudouridine(38/39) synthase [Bicyclus anynana]|uniref:tRNA pseudouridine(38/39) synthase n=1 Tax=Bicyclus anynana TaxID=110368 RepID=A0ABM3LJ39_BICAN|nr:tRNA pseudouridine(38/39) synthase [Bicyclus anynana]XP_052739086.1 tRNA pseudouridine(38/39) synthase [Bicyclus anynana]
MADRIEMLPPKKKRTKGLTKEDLLILDKNDLVERILQLEAHNHQLKNKLSKNLENGRNSDSVTRENRKFDFAKCHYRRVLLHILYFGWDYQGFVVQEDTTQTVEHHLFHALKKSCLIESREKSQYNRCGRTDKGVSAFGQVISITLRSNHESFEQTLPDSLSSELPYCKILNRLLPKDIRAVAWMPIPEDKPEFSARFNCNKRKYKYYFPKSSLDVCAMRTACGYLIGSHDFRHLCKMDVGNNVTEFRREIFTADIVPVDENDRDCATSMYQLVIEGSSFLWHQIRCIMAVLVLVGQGQEPPSVVKELLDVDKYPRKPQYTMALHIPLNLFHCSYDIDDWYYDKEELKNVIAQLQNDWTIHNVKSTMIKDCVTNLEGILDSVVEKIPTDYVDTSMTKDRVMAHTNCLIQGVKPRTYIPLFERETCPSLKERIEYYAKKRRLDETE